MAGAILTRKALELLRVMPKAVDRAALTCAYAVHLLGDWEAPFQVVAGRLRIEGHDAFEDDLRLADALDNAKNLTPGINHLWVMMGSQIVDIALFREAYGARGPAQLAHFVHQQFGPEKALYVDEWRLARRRGISYEPTHVLSKDEVTSFMARAHRALEAR
ncbi:hypothetical protein K3M67_18035 (plasmid) [Sphingobium sp. V4]|uniref:hypothetical protein n=1 Tax=Sphingobium sp. V4 TaxID=3038927 RepID=UPI002558369B|nr:hypothetical protein [Sphingobium sp. V4]WIW90948.1 hypothetical protein K3M67_18035 [Sphingobium sp. V4]